MKFLKSSDGTGTRAANGLGMYVVNYVQKETTKVIAGGIVCLFVIY